MSNVRILPKDTIKQKMYHVVCYKRIDPASGFKPVPLTLAQAYAETDRAELMQPENKYVVELIDETE